MPPDARITNGMLLQGALLFAVLDAFLVPLLAWKIRPGTFRQMRGELLAVTAIFWAGLWYWVIGYFWEPVYQYFFPVWSRWLVPVFQAALTTLVAGLAWRLSARSRPHPVIHYCLIGGLWGAATHLWAVYSGIVEKPAVLRGASPVAAVIIAFFEFILYWCMIIILSALVHAFRRRTGQFDMRKLVDNH